MNFSILGAGAWGTAMAVYLANRGHVVTLVPEANGACPSTIF